MVARWQKRTTLSFVGFLGLALMYSLRFNLSIGIVAMVDHDVHHHANKSQAETGICPALLPINSSSSTNSKISVLSQGVNDNFPKFRWTEKDQGLILGSFFWGYMITQVPGGFLAQRFGAKWVVGLGLLFSGLFALILPTAAMYGGLTAVVSVRILQGLSGGVLFPAFMALLAKWTGPNERAGIATFCFSGMPFGTAVTMIISGHLITQFGWPAVFYVPGVLTILWFLAWSFLVYSCPEEHPRISEEELCEIQKSKNLSHHSEENIGFLDVPWKSILSSLPFLAIFISHFCNVWGHNTLKAEGPKYLNSVLHFDIHENAYVSATPYICQWIFCNIVTRISDYLISKKILSLRVARRLCNTIGQWGTSFAYLGLILSDCDRNSAVTFFVLSGALNGAIYGGIGVNIIDISPNYAGVLEGVINGIANVAGFGAPYVAGLILNSQPNIFGWKMVFVIPVIVDFLGNLCFLIFSSTKVQRWNDNTQISLPKSS